jgi:hypothetical protein
MFVDCPKAGLARSSYDERTIGRSWFHELCHQKLGTREPTKPLDFPKAAIAQYS